MNSTAKVLVPEKEWLIKNNDQKIAGISKNKKGYLVMQKGRTMPFKSLSEIKSQFGIDIFEEQIKKIKKDTAVDKNYTIYDFPCSSKPYEPVYSIKQKLPLFAKSSKSKSRYCAGYYIIKFKKGWVKSFCPKLITLERYPYQGPFNTDAEMKNTLNIMNKS
jgi:hypothetical protein